MPRRFFAVVALCLSALSLSAADAVWLTDLDEGIKVAKAEKKALADAEHAAKEAEKAAEHPKKAHK